MSGVLHSLVCALLSVAVLAGAVLPPGLSHAHAGGDRGHSHHAAETLHHHADVHNGHSGHHCEDSPHRHSHSSVRHDADDHHRCASGQGDDHGIESSAAHLHFSLAGFDFSLPLPVGGRSNGPITSLDGNIVFVGITRLTEKFTVAPLSDAASLVDLTVTDSMTVDPAADHQDGARTRWLWGRGDRFFLCDAARRERSGVLRN